MSQAQDTYQLYKTPSIATIGAYVSVAVAIFFGAYVMSMRSHMTRREIQHQKDLQEARARVDRLTLKLMHVSNELHDTHSSRLRGDALGQREASASDTPARQPITARNADGARGTEPVDQPKTTASPSPEVDAAAVGQKPDPTSTRVAAAKQAPSKEPAVADAKPEPTAKTTAPAARNVESAPAAAVDAPLKAKADPAAKMPVEKAQTPVKAEAPAKEVKAESVEAPAKKDHPESLMATIPDMPELESGVPLTVVSPAALDVDEPRVQDASKTATPATTTVPDTEAFLAEADALEGEIIVFNPEKQLVMVNVGRNRGAEVGRRLTLWRGETYIGDVRVQRVFANMSSCEIISALDQGVRVGDVARSAHAAPAP